jgi:uncharacterized protein (DUF58 family)
VILPSRRWFLGAAALAALAPLTIWWPSVGGAWLALDLLWVLAFLLDAREAAALPLEEWPVSREAPPAFSVGRPLPVSYLWANELARPVHLLVREELPAPLDWPGREPRALLLPASGSTTEPLIFTPARRGKATAGLLHIRALGRWGLAWRQAERLLPWSVIVYPNLRHAALRALPTQAQRRRDAGQRNIRRLGEGRVFESLHEWGPGEETRTIDWKATARRGKLMARRYEDERRQQVMMMIDAGRMLTAESEGRPRLEAAIDAALELAHSAVLHDDNVGLFVFADQVMRFVPPARGRRALRQVLDALASIEGRMVEPDYPAAFAYLAARHRKRGLTVLFTDVIDRTASDALVAQAGSLRPRHLPLAVTLRDTALERTATRRAVHVEEAYQRAAAEELLEAREGALAELRSHGVLVLDVLPDNAARMVVEQYELLKRRALV